MVGVKIPKQLVFFFQDDFLFQKEHSRTDFWMILVQDIHQFFFPTTPTGGSRPILLSWQFCRHLVWHRMSNVPFFNV